MPKNIVVFSDGTGQEGGQGNNTNVYKLFNMVEDRTPDQIAFYDRGLGTTGWRKLTGKATGLGISKNIQECYQFIFENYQAGDQVFLFGFSRGATTVRSLSGLIHYFGILPKSRPELIAQAYDIYKTPNETERKQRADRFLEGHHTMWCRIKCLGVWDTVAALGVPIPSVSVLLDRIPFFRHKFHNLRLSESVENAYHALAIDDERESFHPTFWDQDKPAATETQEQVWFCGMHTDVGGGYPEQQLSDIALEWMIQKAMKHGLKIYPHHKVQIDPDPNGKMHDSRGGGLGKYFRQKQRSWNEAKQGKAKIHESVLRRAENGKLGYHPWILKGKLEYDVEPWVKGIEAAPKRRPARGERPPSKPSRVSRAPRASRASAKKKG